MTKRKQMRLPAKKYFTGTGKIILLFLFITLYSFSFAQQKATDANAPLHALQPEYKVPYKVPTAAEIKTVLDRVYNYLDTVTPPAFVNKQTGMIETGNEPDTNFIFKKADFRLTSYEWGVTYAGMLAAAEATGDKKFFSYTSRRLEFLAKAFPSFRSLFEKTPANSNPLRQMVDPRALDDAGAMCAAMVRLAREGGSAALRPVIDNYIGFISGKQLRLADGTLARNRPQQHTLWLDDLFMSVPALAGMGKLTGDKKYFDDAVKQVLQFSKRMFNKEQGIYMHGWVEEMNVHPEFHWARANGWALMAMTELLNILPENHPGRKAVLLQLQKHIQGLTALQSGEGFWHQLLDRNDSYLETSATAIYTYCIARAINKGWIDAKAYAPVCILAWNAVTTKVNHAGQVEGTCVGTGMAFDPAFYYYRPVNVYAAHGYGPVLLAGAEMTNLLRNFSFGMNDSSIQLKSKNK
jgi:unsaturated rhamnogalacturonyl hydrolase